MRQTTYYCDGAGCGVRIPTHERLEIKGIVGPLRSRDPLHFCEACQGRLMELIGPGAGVPVPAEPARRKPASAVAG